MSTGYNGSKFYLRENGTIYEKEVSGEFTAPLSSTVFAISTNPAETGESLSSTERRTNMEVYSVRIYNKCLTEDEIQKNYTIDKIRFLI